MSDFEDHWRQLCRKTPALLNPETQMTIRVSEFRRLLERAYNRGQADRQTGSPDLFDSFNQIFGGG